MISELISALAVLPPAAEILLKVTVLLSLVWVFKPLISRANPRWQVFYWRCAATAIVLLPPFVFFGPTFSAPLLDAVVVETKSSKSLDVPTATPTVAFHEEAAMQPHAESSAGAEINSITKESRQWSWSAILVAVWILPSGLLLAGALVTDRSTARLVRNSDAVPESLFRILNDVARTMGYTRRIRLGVSAGIETPIVTGILRPAILVPSSLEADNRTDLRGIFAHEVNHLASHDLVWSRIIQLISIIFWFHPLSWGLCRAHLDACERASDAVAAEHVGNADTYAATLAKVALGVIGRRTALSGIAMARGPRIRERLLWIQKTLPVRPLTRRQVIPVVAGGLVLVALLGGLRLVEAAGPDKQLQTEKADSSKKVTSQEVEKAQAKQSTAKAATKYECRLVDTITGQGVVGATVIVQRRVSGGGKQFKEWPMVRKSEYTTDSDGRYTIDFRPDEENRGYLYVEVKTKHPEYVNWYAGYSYGMIKKNLKMGSEPFFKSISIWPAVKLTGKVATPEGKPAAGIEVFGYSKFNPEKFKPRGFFMEAKTNDKGVFELNAVRGGKAVVWLLPKAYSPSTHVYESRPAELGKTASDWLKQQGHSLKDLKEAVKTRDLGRFVLKKGIEIEGRVIDEKGEPVEGVWVNASLTEGPAKKEIGMQLADHIVRSDLTDASGRYHMRPLPPGTYSIGPREEPREKSVEGRSTGSMPAVFFSRKIVLKKGEKIMQIDFKAIPHVTIVAQYYRSSGEPRSGHEVIFFGKHKDGYYSKSCPADAKGRIEFLAPKGLEKAKLGLVTNEHSSLRHRIREDGPLINGRDVELGTLSTDMKEIAIIRYVAPILIIRAVDAEGKMIKDAWISIKYDIKRAPLGSSEYVRNGRSAGHVGLEQHGKGRWRTSQLLPDEEFTLTVEAEGYETRSQKLSMKEGEKRELDVILKPSKAKK